MCSLPLVSTPLIGAPQEVMTSFCCPASGYAGKLFLKVNKQGCRADFPKNDTLCYSRKQLKDSEGITERSPLWMLTQGRDAGSFQWKGRQDSLCQETSAPVDILTGLSAEGSLSLDCCTVSHGEASDFSNYPIFNPLGEEPGDSLWRKTYEQVIF